MDPRLSELLHWSATHHCVLTSDVIRRSGLPAHSFRELVHAGVLERLLDGSYRYTGAPLTEMARCVAASQRPGLVVEGPTAGRIWGLRRMPRDGLVFVIAPPASHPSNVPWIRPYRTALLAETDIVERPDGIRLTSPPRTAVDLARHLTMPDLRSVVDQIVHERMATASTLHAVAEPLATPGRPWARRFLRMLEQRIDGPAPESHWESRVFHALRGRGIDDLTAQHWLEVPDYGRIRLDACVERLRWGVEIDVFPEHFTEEGGTRDRERDLATDLIGWRVPRVARLSLERDFAGCIDRLVASHDRRRAELHHRDER